MACNNPMRRTTSLTEFQPPSVLAVVLEDEDDEEEEVKTVEQADGGQDWLSAFGGGDDGGSSGAAGRPGPPSRDWIAAYRARAAPARAGLRRNSADYSKVETAAFLRHCGLCRRLLGPGKDTFMYKGEAAFCSLECRQQHITHEEWKEKCTVRSSAAAPASRGRSSKTDTGGTVAAA